MRKDSAKTITFNICVEYHAQFGEELVLITDSDSPTCYAMSQADGLWHCSIESGSRTIAYRFELRRGNVTIRQEWGNAHRHTAAAGLSALDIHDYWADKPDDCPLRSSMFRDGIFRRKSRKKSPLPKAKTLTIRAEMPAIRPSQEVVLVGNSLLLGEWDPARGIRLDDSNFPVWSISLDKCLLADDTAFKFVVIDRKSGSVLAWEQGDNHHIAIGDRQSCSIVGNLRPKFDLPRWRGAGTAIPLFSLRSEESFGIGEFYDLRLMVDWAVRTSQSIIQILPINDTTMSGTRRDSYPYNACSTFALHPQYIRLEAVGTLRSKRKMAHFDALGRKLNRLAEVDYEGVNRAKIEYLHAIYEQMHDDLATDGDYRDWVAKNSDWLLPYAAFCTLRDQFGGVDFQRWGEFARYDKSKVAEFIDTHPYEIGYHCFVQYHLAKQLREVRDYAHSQGVVLKGDIPIGISRTSVDAWVYPELFNMSVAAGAPPDDFSVLGQNWGFPTYNWAKMAEDGYAWWRARFVKMAEYFDAYRIDHILGFFRIWEIPLCSVNALLGHFNPALPFSREELKRYGFEFDPQSHIAPLDATDNVLFVEDQQQAEYYHPRITAHNTPLYKSLSDNQKRAYNALYDDFFYRRHNAFWYDEAKRKLPPLLASNEMLVCGEDLGMIPDCVAAVMAEEQILSLEIQRMSKQSEREFGDPLAYPYLAVATTSTHDMNPVRAWWEEDFDLSQRFFNTVLGNCGKAPHDCEPSICRQIVEQHLASTAMLTILPWQDWLAIDKKLRRKRPDEERVNVPADSQHYWRYRMHITLERLLDAAEFNRTVADMIHRSGR